MNDEQLKRELREVRAELKAIRLMLKLLKQETEKAPLVTLRGAAARIGCSYNKMLEIAESGEIGFSYVGKRKMLTEANILDYLNGVAAK